MQILKPSSTLWLYVGHFAPNILTNLVALILILCLHDVVEVKPEAPAPSSSDAAGSSTDSETASLIVEGEHSKAPRMRAGDVFDFSTFLFVVFLCGIAMGIVNTFLFLFIKQLPGGTQLVMGVSVTVTTLFEIPVFFFSTNILNRVPVDWVIAISIAAYCCRWLCYWLYAMYAANVNAWLILVPESFHGLTFALLWAAIVAVSQRYIKRGVLKSGLAMGLCAGTKG